MTKHPFYYVKKRTLLAVAGCVWLIAGYNVARLGILSYQNISSINLLHLFLSLLVFSAFGTMFFKMGQKHTKRIKEYEEEYRPIWQFFDLKAYLIMIVMMGGGIWLRGSGLLPEVFVAVFYTGLGCALTLAGGFFWIMFFRYNK